MPPKKADAKKKDADPNAPDPKQVIGAFKKAYTALCADLQIDEQQLNLGDGTEVFRRLLVHPQCGPVSPLHARALVGALSKYEHLQNLALWNANLQDEGTSATAAYLASNRSVTSLELTDCGIGELGCKALADALERNMTLTRLCLDFNQIGNRGAELLGGLRFNRALTSLELAYCGLTAEAGPLLASGVMRCATLKTLELRGNELGAEGVLAILAQIKARPGLFHLGLADTSVNREPEVQAALLDVMASVSTCCEYDLMGNMLGDAFCYEMKKLADANMHLIDIRVCATSGIDNMLYKQLLNTCASNKKDWIKANKKKGGKKGKGGKKKK